MQRRGRPNRQSRGSSETHQHRQNNHRPQRPRHPDHPSVPPYAAIHPGRPVSIILKQDQPTGHQVRGIVADVLTRGDHPRGVKVRLRDGRVGRVQGLVSESEGEAGEALVGGPEAGLGRDGEGGGSSSRGRGRGMGRGRGGRIERDVRENDEYFYDEGRRRDVDVGLFSALEEADRRHEEIRGGNGHGAGGSEIVKCPVCGKFEGDELAVAHHVETHFKD